MTWTKSCNLSAKALVIVSFVILCMTGAQAQSTDNKNKNGMGGSASTGTGVKTGKGPLSQPIPPAVSTMNPQPSPQRPQNMQGPTQTNPSQQPFGTK